MSRHDILVIGASAGGVEALVKLVGSFPDTLPAAVFIVLHIPPESPSQLPAILTRAGALPADHPKDGTCIEHGRIYIAPPDHHLLLEQDHVRVVRGPKENRHRPAIDPLFRSAARSYGPRVIGVILTGSLDDGTAGLLAIKRQGGKALVQDPKEALYPGMPQSALDHVAVDVCGSLAEIAQVLPQMVKEPAQPGQRVPKEMEKEVEIAALRGDAINDQAQVGHPSVFSCPECGGVLWEIQDSSLTRFRCRTGHAFTSEGVLAEQMETVERSLWFALKTLDEQANLAHRLAQRANDHGRKQLAQHFLQRMREAAHHASSLRRILEQTTHQVEQVEAETLLEKER